MNWKSLFIISTVFWIGLFFVTNCSQKTPEMVEDMDETLGVTICPPPDNATAAQKAKCENIHTYIDSYASLTELTGIEFSFVAPGPGPADPPGALQEAMSDGPNLEELATELSTLRGFKYALSDLKNITKYSKKHGIDSVYLMLAINTDPASIANRKNSPIKYLDMYFQAVNKGKTMTFLQGEGMMLDGFDNFPKPCPNSCPPPDTTQQVIL